MEIDSAPGKGTTVRIAAPLAGLAAGQRAEPVLPIPA